MALLGINQINSLTYISSNSICPLSFFLLFLKRFSTNRRSILRFFILGYDDIEYDISGIVFDPQTSLFHVFDGEYLYKCPLAALIDTVRSDTGKSSILKRSV